MSMGIDKVNAAPPGRQQADEFVRQLRAELKENSGQWQRLARLSNGELTHSWLVHFASADIVTPRADKLLTLAMYLGFRVKLESGPHFNKFAP